jgi:long-chain acyl-CoA synthetase
LEGCYQKNKFILQIFIYGDSTQVALVAVVVPDPDVLLPWAKENNISSTSVAELCNMDQVKKAIFQDMNATAKESKVKVLNTVF